MADDILRRSDFPDGFIFGAATAAYQIEGHRFGGAGPCHWDTFSASGRNVVRNEDGSLACDHYHRWPEDLDLLKDGGFDAYRFSTSWARVMPDAVTTNPDGLDFYDKLLDGILERGLRPYLTLYHWDLPSALADEGGWTNRATAQRFADYAAVVMARLGDRLDRTATINEPWCVSWLSHYIGEHAPGLRDIRAAARAMHHILLAHGLAVERLRSDGHANLGIVLNFVDIIAADDTPQALAALDRADAISNRWFIEALSKGTYPTAALDGLAPHMPPDWQGDMATISTPIDWLGVNYYTRETVSEDPGTAWPAIQHHDGPLPKTQMGWEIHPDGLANLLIRIATDYVGNLPIAVTENGMAWDDRIESGAVNDTTRVAYLRDHIAATRRAMEAGANVDGYFCWSLLDNFEWAFGYEKRFGIVHVDFDTLKRTPKASYLALKAALTRR